MATLTIKNMDDADYQEFAFAAQDIEKLYTDEQIEVLIGAGVSHLHLGTAPANYSADQGFKDLIRINVLDKKQARKKGKKFVERVKNIVCKSSWAKDVNDGKIDLKDTIHVVVPMILGLLGVGALNPILMGVIVAVLAKLAMQGIGKFCNI